jgi:hypothetical protein
MLAGGADAAKKFESARFKVTAKGTQTVTWDRNHPDMGACDVSMTGGGLEKVKFKTKPTVVNACMAPGSKRPVLTGDDGLLELRGKATITRQDNTKLGPRGPEDGINCPGGSGGGDPVSDCGTKTADWRFQLFYNYTTKDRLQFDGMNSADPFKHCNAAGYGFPYFTDSHSQKRKLPQLPANELFDDSLGQITVIGKGKSTIREAEFSSDGKIVWDVEFKRLKGKPKP